VVVAPVGHGSIIAQVLTPFTSSVHDVNTVHTREAEAIMTATPATTTTRDDAHRPSRRMADVTEPVVVFLVGMRINSFRRWRAWLPVSRAMTPMIRELFSDPSLGLLNARSEWSGRTITVVTYWRSFEHLERYAHAASHAHRPAWTAFYRRAAASGGAVGLFHETFTVQPGTAESLYVDMPDGFGLGGAVGMVPIRGSLNAARERLDRRPGDTPADAPEAASRPAA
jgi:hypothetical protein